MTTHVMNLARIEVAPVTSRLNQIMKSVRGAVTRGQRRRQAAGNLRALNDNMLRDIGIHRSQIILRVHSNDVEIHGGNDAID